MFVVILTYVKPLADVDKHMKAHMAWLNAQYQAKHFIASGRQLPRTGGVILARAESREALQAIVEQDPFVTSGCATAQIIQFRTSQYDDGFAPFADPGT